MQAIQVIDTAHLVPLPAGRSIMVGAPPEALKILVLWDSPFPSVVVLPPDPLYAHGVNQASFEFLLYNYLFRMNGLRDRRPFVLVCEEGQRARVESMVRHMLRGPTDAEMEAFRTPASHRRQLLLETTVVSGEVSKLRLDQMARVITFRDGVVDLPDHTRLRILPDDLLEVTSADGSVVVPRQAPRREPLPLYFADVAEPVRGPRFGLQVIGSASGFSGAEWGSCFIVWINGLPLIIDGTPYLDEHLLRLGIEDDHILGYLLTHNHEDHANAISQLVNRRPVTVLTSGPVMAGLVARLSAILNCPAEEVRELVRWVPLMPGMNGYGEALHWFGAEIRTWYSVHTVPTLGVDISMQGKHIRMPGDTLWGRQLEPLLEQQVISDQRYHFIQHTYDDADVIVADAGGGPIHPDPQEVLELISHGHGAQLMVTHIPEFARPFLPIAEPGTSVELIPGVARAPEEGMGLFGSPVLREVPERWLLCLLSGGEIESPGEEPIDFGDDALFVLAGGLSVRYDGQERFRLQRGDLFHAEMTPERGAPELVSSARWTRLLRIPRPLYHAFLRDTGIFKRLARLMRTRAWWRPLAGAELGLDTLVTLASLCREKQYRQGTRIVAQRQPGTSFYVVIEGEVQVDRVTDGTTHLIGTYGPGYFFGEIALLSEELRTATVTARTAVRALELPARSFHHALLEIPLIRYRLGREADRRRKELEHVALGELAAPGATGGVREPDLAAALPHASSP